MTSVFVVIELPAADADDLDTLGISDVQIGNTHGLDGSEIITAITVLTPSTFLFLRAWLRARVDLRKNFSVTVDGQRLQGYTAKEVTKIIETLERQLPPAPPDA